MNQETNQPRERRCNTSGRIPPLVRLGINSSDLFNRILQRDKSILVHLRSINLSLIGFARDGNRGMPPLYVQKIAREARQKGWEPKYTSNFGSRQVLLVERYPFPMNSKGRDRVYG